MPVGGDSQTAGVLAGRDEDMEGEVSMEANGSSWLQSRGRDLSREETRGEGGGVLCEYAERDGKGVSLKKEDELSVRAKPSSWSGFKNFLKHLGPGIIFAGVSIGTSHIVQSTKAGADFGFWAAIPILIASAAKFPFYEIATRYAAGTGESLLVGYKKRGVWVLAVFLVFCLFSAITTTATLSLVTAGMGSLLFKVPQSFKILWLAGLVGVVNGLILLIGKYHFLDMAMKVVSVVFVVSTMAAFFAAVSVGPQHPEPNMSVSDFLSGAGLTQLITLMGWMPTALDVSVWISEWQLEKERRLQKMKCGEERSGGKGGTKRLRVKSRMSEGGADDGGSRREGRRVAAMPMKRLVSELSVPEGQKEGEGAAGVVARDPDSHVDIEAAHEPPSPSGEGKKIEEQNGRGKRVTAEGEQRTEDPHKVHQMDPASVSVSSPPTALQRLHSGSGNENGNSVCAEQEERKGGGEGEVGQQTLPGSLRQSFLSSASAVDGEEVEKGGDEELEKEISVPSQGEREGKGVLLSGYRDMLLDFRIGYILTTVLAIVFLTLGRLAFFGRSGEPLNKGAVGFASQFVKVYTDLLGHWCHYAILVAAFSAMWSSAIGALDGYVRTVAGAVKVLGGPRILSSFAFWLVYAVGGSFLLLWGVGPRLHFVVALTTGKSFCAGFAVAIVNLLCLKSSEVSPEVRYGRVMEVLCWVAIAVLAGLTGLFLVNVAMSLSQSA